MMAQTSASRMLRRANDRTSATIELRLTHEEIGSMIKASRETVTRLLKEFRRSGLVSVAGSRITVNDIPRLSSFADERVLPADEA